MVLFTLLSPAYAFATQPTYGSKSAFGNNGNACGSSEVCGPAQESYTKLNLGRDEVSASPYTCTSSPVNADQEWNKLGTRRDISHAQDNMRLCCNAGTNKSVERCMANYGTAAGQKAYVDVMKQIAEGVKGDATVQGAGADTSQMTGNMKILAEAMAGACRAAREVCAASVNAAVNGTSCGAETEKLADKGISECRSIDPSTIESQLKQSMVDNSGAGKVVDGSKKDGTDSTSGGKSSKSGASSSGGMGGMNPMAMMQMMQQMMKQNETQPTAETPLPALQDCTQNPAIAGCAQVAAANAWTNQSVSGSSSQPEDSSGSFNPADASSMTPQSVEQAAAQMGAAVTNSGVPNGGGGMPGGGGGGAASLGSSGATGGGAVPGGGKKIEFQGERGGGGYSSTAAGMNMKSGESGGGYSYGGGYAHNSEDNLDLSAFLPGGKQDPTRKLAGASSTGNFQIQSKDVNLFSRISERIKSRCAQGLLRDCIP